MQSVLHYQNYREFLKDFYEQKKGTRTGFTYAKFATKAGLKSPNYFKLVMDGQKNLTPENIIRFSRTMELQENECDYFEALVHFNQAKNNMEKRFHQDRLKRIQQRATGESGKTIEEYEFESISSWLHHAVMVLTNVKHFRDNPAWIRAHLFDLASEAEVQQILDQLIKAKLVHRDAQGRLKQTHKQLSTKPELQRLSAKMFYEGLLKRAIQGLSIATPEQREFSTYLVGLSPEKIPEMKRRVREFMKDLKDWAMEDTQPTQVHAFCFAGFPISKSTG